MRNRLADGLVIFFIVPHLLKGQHGLDN